METYNEHYYKYYRTASGAVSYEEPEQWMAFFGQIADHIVADFAPKTVLDAGCAMGYLVAALRDRGVEAYGIDISKYAISRVREDVKPYCACVSLTEQLPQGFPKHFDIVTSIEVLEHLYSDDGAKAIDNLCGLTDMLLFSSTPNDYTEPTHVNVQQREYWARLFAQCGFFNEVSYQPQYVSSYAVCYRRESDFLRQVEKYERVIGHYAYELKEQSDRFDKDIDDLQEELLALQEEVNVRNMEIIEYRSLVDHERREAAIIAEAYNVISNSTFWKLTKPGRVILDALKAIVFRPAKNLYCSLKTVGLCETLKKNKIKQTGQPQSVMQMPAESITNSDIKRNLITGHPVDGIQTILVDEDVNRLNLVTDTLDASSLLGGVATALIVATEFVNRYDYELRIITRNTEANPMEYTNIMNVIGVQPAKKLSFYSDYERFSKPVDLRMEISPKDVFFATSWWSAEAVKNITIRPRFFYIIQEVETFFYNYSSERMLCERVMEDSNIDYIINSHYLKDYFAENNPNITEHGCYFEPAFPIELYSRKTFANKNRYKLFFYARPNNPRNLYGTGVELLRKAVDRGIVDLEEWDIYCVGQDAPYIHFSDGKSSINLGQLSWAEYARFLGDVDLGLCLMYTPHPSYPPFDVACSGGVVLSNKMLNKQSFEMCKNVIMADLDEESFMKGFEEAVALAKNMKQRKRNYESNEIPHCWSAVLNDTMTFMGAACENV